MKSPVAMARSSGLYRAERGFTLVEVLIATAIALLLMAGIVTLFASVSETVTRGQAMMETVDRLRGVQHRLQTDLKYVTARMVPPLDPSDELGYTEIIEGAGPYLITGYGTEPINGDTGGNDTTVGDVDDIFMCTVRSFGEPFIGKAEPLGPGDSGAFSSQVAEVCWFLRGTTLYRRVLLISPEKTIPSAWYNAMYAYADISVRQEGGSAETHANWGGQRLVTNSLGDLTKRENRYAHTPRFGGHPTEGYPHDVRWWSRTTPPNFNQYYTHLGLPTLQECSDPTWPFPLFGARPIFPNAADSRQIDYWVDPYGPNLDRETGALPGYDRGQRVAQDVALKNVLSFDVKVWDGMAPVFSTGSTGGTAPVALLPGDPGYRAALQTWVANNMPANQVMSRGAYVDLYYTRGIAGASQISWFSGPGNPRSQLHAPNADAPAIWDTGSTHYEYDGVDQDGNGIVDDANDGLDNNNVGGVDDFSERETAPPYNAPVRSIQIKIRVFEPDSRQIREVTVTQDFLP